MKTDKYLGLDVHKDTTVIAIAEGGRDGESRKLSSITKTGNSHARWILGEVVQHAFLPPKVSAHLSRRQQGLLPAHKELSWKMQTRLF
ncbi:MAG TPA: hypothetical protein PLN52_01585 [Opitutaceae bacterium]|nr:hypothetical protein [Opitutaceae bacterium]